jgi:hypothetical protein
MREKTVQRTLVRVRAPKVDKFKFYDLVIYAARGSTGARRLATALGCRRWRDDLPERYTRRRPYFRGNDSPMVVNWGSTVPARWLTDGRFRLNPVWVNSAKAVNSAINKLEFFRQLCSDGKPAGSTVAVPLLKWTTNRDEALEWLKKKDCKGIVARTKLTGSSGQGIVLSTSADSVPTAPLYTRVYPKTHEFRVHVFNGRVIDTTQKKLKGGPNDVADRFIRSHDNGWVHAHDGIDLSSDDRGTIGVGCIAAVLGLDLVFGAVDVLAILEPPDADRVRRLKSYVVCEVNTGPGLENTATIEAYSKAILELKEEKKNHAISK